MSMIAYLALSVLVVVVLFLGFAAYAARREGISFQSWLIINTYVRLAYAKQNGLDQLRAAIADDRAKGPARPSASIRRRYRVTQSHVAGMEVMRVARNSDRPGRPLLLYLHGGAYVYDLVAPQWVLITGLIDRADVEVVIPLYPLAPEHTVTTVFPMVEAVYQAVAAEAGARNVGLGGDSAGAGFALALAHHLRDHGKRLPKAMTLFFPWLDVTLADPDQVRLETIDLTLSMTHLREAGRMWAGELPPEHPRVSPLFGDQSGLPPVLVQSGGRDILVADARRFAARCPEAISTEYPGMFHGWICGPLPEGRAALDEAGAFLRRHLAS